MNIRAIVSLILLLMTGILCLPTPVRSDIVHLKNGRKLEGVVDKETARDITLKVGIGTITLKRSKISSIEKSGKARQELEEKWRADYFLHEKYVPKGLKDVASAYQDLIDTRRAAVEAKSYLDQTPREQENLYNQLQSLQRQYRQNAEKLKEKPTRKQIKTYNETVSLHNQLNGRILGLHDKVDAIREAKRNNAKKIGSYLAKLTTFQAQFIKAKKEYKPESKNSNSDIFFKKIARELLNIGKDIELCKIPYEQEGDHAVLIVRINDKIDARFLLDTGASVVSISETMAQRLGLDLSEETTSIVTVADGRRVNAKPIILRSLEVGDARVDHVPAIVLPSEPADGIDGLLGMSFLREFVITYDAANSRFLLKRFTPK